MKTIIEIIDRLHNIYYFCEEDLDDIVNGIIAKESFINSFIKFMKKNITYPLTDVVINYNF